MFFYVFLNAKFYKLHLCSLIDIEPDRLKLCCRFLYIAMIYLHDTSVYRHFSKVCFHIACGHLFHFFFLQGAFFLCHAKLDLHRSFPVAHALSLLSVQGVWGTSQQAKSLPPELRKIEIFLRKRVPLSCACSYTNSIRTALSTVLKNEPNHP